MRLDDPRLAQAITSMVDRRVAAALAAGAVTRYGVVAAVDDATSRCSVYLGGSTIPSPGFVFAAHQAPWVGESVRVVMAGADRYVDQSFPSLTVTNPGGVVMIPQDKFNGDTDSLVWPRGHSIMAVSAATGWPATTGTVLTWMVNSARMAQWFYRPQESVGAVGATWYRTGHSTNTPNQWTAWQRMDRRQRWVALEDQAYSPWNGTTRTTAIDSTLELTMLPSDGSVLAATGIVILSCTVAGNGYSCRLRNYNSGTSQSQGLVVYPQVAGALTSSAFIVNVGGTNARSIRYQFVMATAATMTYYMNVNGYWTDA